MNVKKSKSNLNKKSKANVDVPEFEEVVSKKKNLKPQNNLSKEQQEIINLKSQLMIEKVKNINKSKENFVTKKKPRKFSDTQYDKNATPMSILKGAAVMFFAFGMLALLLFIVR